MEKSEMKNKHLNDEASQGFESLMENPPVASRKERRKQVKKLEKFLPVLKAEVEAFQEAYENNYPNELDDLTDEERWELLDEENKSRRSEFYKALFKAEMYFTASAEYIATNGKNDLFAQMDKMHHDQISEKVLEERRQELIDK